MKKRFTCLCLCLMIVVTIMASSAPFAMAETSTGNNGTSASATGNTDKTSNKKLTYQSLDEFERISTDGDLELYMLNKEDQLICLAVHDTKLNRTWYTSPSSAASITNALRRREINSQMIVNYQDANDQNQMISSGIAVRDGNVKTEKIDKGVKITYSFPDNGLGFTIPLIFKLNNNAFEASVDFKHIKVANNSVCKLMSITLLPYFACGELGKDGYLFVPDGSGALIDNNYAYTGTGLKRYEQWVYGRDSALLLAAVSGYREPTPLPVFGIKSEDAAVLGVIDQGAALAKVKATPAKAETPFASNCSEFTYLNTDTFATSTQWNQKQYQKPAAKTSQIPECKVKYYFMAGDDADYVGMAHKYQLYLKEQGAGKNVASNLPFYMDVVGAVKKTESRFGFVMDVVKPVTKFEDAQKMISELDTLGVSNMNMRYLGWMKGGLESGPITNAKTESKLGGKSGLLKLKDTAKSKNVNLFMDVELLKIYKSKFGWLKSNYAVQNVLRDISYQYYFDLSTGIKQDDNDYMLMTPTLLQKETNKFLNQFKKYDISNISLGSFGNTVYSEFAEGDRFRDRQQTADALVEVMNQFKKSQGQLMVDGGNGYSLAVADHIIAPPMYDSGDEISMTDVPFLQIALHGIVNYTETAHNLAAIPEMQFLRQLETGSAPYYVFTYKDCSILQETNYSYIYSGNYEFWKDNAASDYKKLAAVLNGYCDKPITDHQIISDKVRVTTYDGKMQVVVNYGATEVKYEGQTVPAGGYIVKEVA